MGVLTIFSLYKAQYIHEDKLQKRLERPSGALELPHYRFGFFTNLFQPLFWGESISEKFQMTAVKKTTVPLP